MATDLSTSLQELLIDFLRPLEEAARDPKALIDWLASLGHTEAVSGNPTLLQIAQHAQAVIAKLEAIDAQTLESTSGLISLLATGREVGAILKDLRAFAADPARNQFAQGLAEEVMHFLLASYLRRKHPTAFRMASVLTLIEARETAAMEPAIVANRVTLRYARVLDRFKFGTLSGLFHQPGATLKAIYFPNDLAQGADAWLGAQRLFPNLSWLADAIDLSWRSEFRPTVPVPPAANADPDEPILDVAANPDDDPQDPATPEAADEDQVDPPLTPLPLVPDDYFASNVPVLRLDIAGDAASSGIALEILVASSKHPGGIGGLILALAGDFNRTETRGQWKLTFSASDLIPALSVGPNGFARVPGDNPLASGTAKLLIERIPDTGSTGPAFLFGSPQGTRLEIGTLKLTGDLSFDPGKWSASLGVAASSGALVLAPSDGDSFLSSVLPTNGARAEFDLGLAWSNTGGFSLRGGAGLEATLPIGRTVAGVTLSSVHVSLQAQDDRLLAETSLTMSASIGPVQAAVDRIGLVAALSFPDSGGNLGVADLDFGFKPPSGVGLAIDATGVSGGGYLGFDPEKGQYAGDIQLNLDGGITVTAIGLIATRLPNDAKGFSFVVLITAQGFKPIPLGLGFTLTGIGGLLAINRTCNQEFLREGIKSKTLDSLLFPDDPIRNAVQILGTLNNAFPPRDGSYLFGPVVQICWGTPPVLTMDLGLILELGNRTRLIILGRVSAILPSEKHDLLRLQMNVLGILDFDQHAISLDAILYDSRLVGKFPVTGSMAMRLNWGSAPAFALSIGGFHPAFKPPANFPTLERLAISLSNTDDFRLRSESYIAITANTLQFGAKVELFAKAGGFSIEGLLGYDVLIQFDPFFFLADFYASVQLKYGSDNLFKVKVEGELAGPKPLHIKGKATFEIFWCDFSVHFDKTLVAGDPPPQLAPVIVMDQLKVALNEPRNWSGQLAEGDRRLVTLHERQAPDQIALHPLGTLSVKQTVVPLELQIARFGNTTPAGARLFRINSLSVNGKNTEFSPVKDFFAPSQFLDLSDDERLAAPSFEAMTAGIRVGTESFVFTTNDLDIVSDDTIKYETIILDEEENQARPAPTVAITAEFLNRHLSLGAAARSEVRRTGTARYRSASSKNSLVKKGWTIASTEDASAQAAPGLDAGKVVSYAESFQALQQLKQVNPVKAKTLMLMRVGVGEIEKKVK